MIWNCTWYCKHKIYDVLGMSTFIWNKSWKYDVGNPAETTNQTVEYCMSIMHEKQKLISKGNAVTTFRFAPIFSLFCANSRKNSNVVENQY